MLSRILIIKTPLLTVVMLLSLTLLVGCRCTSSCCLPETPAVPCVCMTAFPDGQSANVADLVPVYEDAELLQPLPTPAESFCQLDPATCQCNAAVNANLANLVKLEQHWASTIIECDSRIVRENLCLNRDLLVLHEYDLRSEAAVAAVESLYNLAALEARIHYLELALQENRNTLARIDALEAEGLETDGLDRGEVEIVINALKDRRLQADYTRLQLNGQLQKLLACYSNEFQFYWPSVDWVPNLTPVDISAEVAQGMAHRSDMRGVQLVLCKLEKGTLRVARGVLNIADSTLGSVEPTEGWIHRLRCIRCSGHEVDVRCKQLALLYTDTENLATAELKNAAYRVAMQQKRVMLARQSVEDRRESVYRMEEKRDVEETTIFEISRERSRLFDAEGELVQQIANLKIARVKLKFAQGTLGQECGYTRTLCTEGCCDGACMRCKK
ncbi:TolC family protein [Adhaeretor mobilis]|uniref:Uncharacterized protein n=1 Tax=Adhaeretor mobilis TaxID=1930276 RepID=A0A517MT37_9BACT|nr:TolC family protein [Adhaeretor mobilis]QDS98050.1 hypothetical protein HG15A2_13210 [Adhaeretor mobilis]